MKTDRFSDSIRRKLESIRPDFKEKDWARMQATLLQHTTPPPPGSPTGFQPVADRDWWAQPWLLAAAVITAVLVGIAIWQRAQINDLRQTISQLSGQKTAPLPHQTPAVTTAPNTTTPLTERQTDRRNAPTNSPQTQSTNQNITTVTRHDTVYITRYVSVPASPARGRTTQELADRSEVQTGDKDATDHVESLAKVQPQQRQTSRSASGQRNDVADDTSSVSTGTTNYVTDAKTNGKNNRAESTSRPGRSINQKTDMSSKDMTTRNAPVKKRRSSASATLDDVVISDGATSTSAAPAQSADVNVALETTRASASSYELITSRPITTKDTDWSKALSYRAGQLRPARTTGVDVQAAPESQPNSPVAFGFRIGAGAETMRSVRSGGVLGELLVGKHLTLGVGLGLASFAGGTFITDEDFNRKKRQNFRLNYVRGIDPRSEILNIGTHTERLLIPITVGYRIPVSQTISLLPSIGTTLNLNTHEYVTFTYRQPFHRRFEAASYRIFRQANLMNSLNFGAGVEWKQNHWVWQAGPVITIPAKPDPNWKEGTTIGLRARLFYQF